MKTILKKIGELTPYFRNEKKHGTNQINDVAESIRRFGFVQPIVIDKKGGIIIGHCRFLAAKKLGIKEVPCLEIDGLAKEDIAELRIIDNKTNESEWDWDALREILPELDFSEFNFTFELPEEKVARVKAETQERTVSYLNLQFGDLKGGNKFEFPEFDPETFDVKAISEWIPFNFVLSDKGPRKNKGVHFFIHDYQFERVWNSPEKYTEVLREYAAVATPDFSVYGDMPFVMQLWNIYRKNWMGAFWQQEGLTVIPSITIPYDRRAFEFFLDGVPRGGVVCISTMDPHEYSMDGYQKILTEIKPSHILVYGDGKILGVKPGDPVSYIPQFVSRFKDNNNNKHHPSPEGQQENNK